MPRENANQLIIEKIAQLQSALFFPETSDPVLPPFVLQEIKTDHQQQIWFAVASPAYPIDPSYITFPCRMEFFRKGAACHVKINGIATLMNQSSSMTDCPLLLPESTASSVHKEQLIVKVQIQQGEVFEIPPMPLHKKNYNIVSLVSTMYNKIAGQLFGKSINPAVPSYN